MSGLVGYASSEEDEEDQQVTEELKTADHSSANGNTTGQESQLPSHTVSSAAIQDGSEPAATVEGPLPAPAAHRSPAIPIDPSLSPRSANRAMIQQLTMPRHANFDIPPSPPPPDFDSEEADRLRVTTKKFDRFLELKKQGVHFNDRLASSAALKNPAMVQKLMEFAGISPAERYENTLDDANLPMTWTDGHLEQLLQTNAKNVKEEKAKRTKLDFVPAKSESG